ncbi:cupin domain-containing protein [Siculibacillus lacustris]|uniref:Cupin domain-containing protein n=1 Tax=Siculibacillus lacustris TaxID=1549641 RepID=A0A4Q9VVY8_9HYPH|nr:cupin domain-containing protein [Siculibacillus lacustris]TBW40446.1 cupin domain-containing protein [Siculibacillus lacustris]
MPTPPAFDPRDVPESNASALPEPFRTRNSHRWYRRLGAHAGLTNFGVNLTRIEPGGQSSVRHAHSAQDEFVWVVAGEVVLETDAGTQTLVAGQCAGFPAGTGDAHRFVNRSASDATILVIGDRTAGDRLTYPDDDISGYFDSDGNYHFTRKDGSRP